jgi:AcrR family transcriptional regulator
MSMTVTAARKDTYHHGDLRRVLMDAAMRLVEERGVDGFTMREVARRAGVSHNAPYHHFEDKAAVVAALAEEGYEMLLADEMASIDPAAPVLMQIRALGRAYVGFAAKHPDRFRLMNRPELRSSDAVTDVQAAGAASEAPLIDAIAHGQRTGVFAQGDAEALALAAWSMVHGLAMIAVDGPMRAQVRSPRQLRSMTDAVVDVLLDGLLARPSATPRR